MSHTISNADNHNKTPLFLGIDGGGSKCRVRLEDSKGNVLGEGVAGPANIVRSVSQTQEAIITATMIALTNAQLSASRMADIQAVAGLAGANVSSAKQRFLQWQHPFAALTVTTDLHIACEGAHQHHDGAVIILGTGFCAGAKSNQEHIELGGHGLLLSDGASGAWLGLALVRKTLEVLDGLALASPATDALLSQLQVNSCDALVSLAHDEKPAFFASLAALVLQASDADSHTRNIIEQAANFVGRYVRHLTMLGYPRIALIGGIAAPLTPHLSKAVRSCLYPPLATPEVGALRLARAHYQAAGGS
ncbi:BadF/BadG/BcrA/BcrD ATPase family protein [Pseudoalteromonas fenneropenaei]|uniref:BadF/BadG/BcrA/BcrD ATPase family protein n=1 Tax=Pseudoalteromonas fenneropenaei TaxID=1737459 RepID=A0ABV7CI51_9GAMM